MAGKREKKTNRRWLKLMGTLLLLTVTVLMVIPLTGSTDADKARYRTLLMPGSVPEPEPVPVANPWGQRPPSVSEMDPFLPDVYRWKPLVRQSEAVEDSYFADAAFLGDSRTEGFKLYSGLKQGQFYYGVGATVLTVFNRPVWKMGGDKLPLLDALQRAEMPPQKIYIMLGVNELGWNKSASFREQYGKVIDRVRGDFPDSEIVLQSILPVTEEQEAKHTYVNNRRIREYNELILSLAAEKQCWYVDVAEAVTDEHGYLGEDLSFDGVHLNRAGCRLWLDYLKTHPVERKGPPEGEVEHVPVK